MDYKYIDATISPRTLPGPNLAGCQVNIKAAVYAFP